MRLGSQLELQTLELDQYLEFGTLLDMHQELRTFGSYWDLELEEMQNPAYQSDKTRNLVDVLALQILLKIYTTYL